MQLTQDGAEAVTPYTDDNRVLEVFLILQKSPASARARKGDLQKGPPDRATGR